MRQQWNTPSSCRFFSMFVLGLIDCSRLIWSYAMLSRAAEDAARCAVVNTVSCGSATDITTYAAGQAWGWRGPRIHRHVPDPSVRPAGQRNPDLHVHHPMVLWD